jgi:hypothetical protein
MKPAQKPPTADHDKISFTAYLTAYWRSLSDRPYAKEVADILHAEKVSRDVLGDKLEPMSWFGAPMVESRGKALECEVERIGHKDIYGIAEGALPTGLAMTADPKVTYVHSDLPDMLSAAEKVLRRIILRDKLSRPNLHFKEVDLFDRLQLNQGANVFKQRPFTVCCSGLFIYLKDEEKRRALGRIGYLLRRHPGSAFVTTDINYKNTVNTMINSFGPDYAKMMKECVVTIAALTGGRNIRENFFETADDAHRMIDQAGLVFERRPFYDGSFTMSSLDSIPASMRDAMRRLFSDRYVYVMRPL